MAKEHLKFMGADVPYGQHPLVDGQRCWLFMDVRNKVNPRWYVAPVSEIRRAWGW